MISDEMSMKKETMPSATTARGTAPKPIFSVASCGDSRSSSEIAAAAFRLGSSPGFLRTL